MQLDPEPHDAPAAEVIDLSALRRRKPGLAPSLKEEGQDQRIRAGGRHGGGLRAWLAARHWTDLEAGRALLDDLVLHDEFLHTLRLFLDFHDYDGRAPSVIKPADQLIVQRGREKWAKKNADGEIVQSEKDEDWTLSPSTLGQARRRSLALTAATSSWVGA